VSGARGSLLSGSVSSITSMPSATPTTAASRTPAFPFRQITVATGEDRLAALDAAVAHFTPEDGTPASWTEEQYQNGRFRYLIDAAGRPDEEVANVLRALSRRDPDEVAVREVPGKQTALALWNMAQVGCAAVCSVNVPSTALALNFFAGASNWQAQPRDIIALTPALLEANVERAEAAAKHQQDSVADDEEAKWSAREDVAAQLARMPEDAERLTALIKPFARMRPDIARDAATLTPLDSYVGGHPFTPEGVAWPVDEDGAMVFLCQINFADVPALPGFPTEGMVQWFVGSGDSYGKVYEGPEAGRSGLHVRWYSPADLSAATAAVSPTHPVPCPVPEAAGAFVDGSPLIAAGPVPVAFTSEDGLPSITEVNDVPEDSPSPLALLDRRIEDYAETTDADLEDVYDGDDAHSGFGCGDRVGGYGIYAQGDPRHEHPDRDRTLLVQLDSDHGFFTMWGDGGAAQLFGDPAALAEGDVSSTWWDWYCH
jgi:uncharacterized protein YwqG